MGEFKTEMSVMKKKEEPVDIDVKKEPTAEDSDSEKKSEEPAEKFYSRTSSVQDLREDPPQGKSQHRQI